MIVFFLTAMLSQNFKLAVSAQNFGITFDNNLNFSIFHKLVIAAFITFVTFVVFACISLAVAKTIVIALVSSKLDYCNSLYHNIALKDILKLQRVENCLARVVTRSLQFSSSLPLLKSLHWLPDPVQYRIIFKIYNYLSSTFIQATSIFTFTTHSCKTAQTASII